MGPIAARGATAPRDERRRGTTPFACLHIVDGTVVGRITQRHRHPEYIRFLNAPDRAMPAGEVVHVILDCPKETRSGYAAV